MISETLIELIKKDYFVFIYGITWIISMTTYKKYYNTILKYLPVIIAYTFLNELLAIFIRHTDYFSLFSHQNYTNANDIIYNIFDLIFFGFFYYIYWKLVKSKKARKWIIIGSSIALLSYIVSAFYQNPMIVSLFVANAISCWILLSFIIIYFSQLRPNWSWQLQRRNLVFWISIGLAIFHLFFPFIFTTAYLSYEIWQTYHFQSIIRLLIIIMYSIFCIGFIVSRKKSFE